MKIKSFLLGILIIGLSFNAFAYDDTLKPSESDIRTWSQDDRIWKNNSKVCLNWAIPEYTISDAGCGLFVITDMLYKSGNLLDKENYLDVLNQIRKNNLWDTSAPSFHIDGRKLNTIYSDISIVNSLNEELWCYSLSDKVKKECLAILKYLYNKGYFISICFDLGDNGSHYVFLDSFIASDNFTIMDSLYPETQYKGSIYDSDSVVFSYLNVYKSEKVKNNLEDSLYGVDHLEKVDLTSWEKKYINYLKTGEGRQKKWLQYDDFMYKRRK